MSFTVWPKYLMTARVLWAELSLFGIGFITIVYYVPISSLLWTIVWLLPLFGPMIAYTIYKWDERNEESTFKPDRLEFTGLVGVFLLLTIVHLRYTLITSIEIALVPPIIGGFYVYRLFVLMKLYARETGFYTDAYSTAGTEWLEAAVAFQKADTLAQSGNKLMAIFWLAVSVGRYTRVVNSVDANRNEYEFLAAKRHLDAAKSLLKAQIMLFFSERKVEAYYKRAQEQISASNMFLSQARCDNCGRVFNRSSMTRIIDETGTAQSKVCPDCDDEIERVICSTCERTVHQTEIIGEYCTNCHPYRKENYEEYVDNSESSVDYGQAVEEACRTLGITEPITEEKVTAAYREKMKTAHPDVGGSKEAFQKVQNAKEVLIDD